MTPAPPGTAALPRVTVSKLLDFLEQRGMPMPFSGGPREQAAPVAPRPAEPTAPASVAPLDPMFGGQVVNERGTPVSAAPAPQPLGRDDDDYDDDDDYVDDDGDVDGFGYGPDAGVPGNGEAVLAGLTRGSGIAADDGIVDNGALTISTGFALVDLELTPEAATEAAAIPVDSHVVLGLRLWRGRDGTRRITATSVKVLDVAALLAL